MICDTGVWKQGMLKKIICWIRGHDKAYWQKERIVAEKAMGGVFTPYRCIRCGFESPVFPYPKPSRDQKK